MAGDFKDLVAWQEAVELVADVTVLVRSLRGPGAFDAAQQILRAAQSVPANIAEGYGRNFSKDYCRFLRIAIGSATEVESRVEGAIRAGNIERAACTKIIERARRVRALMNGLLKYVERKIALKKTGTA